MRSKSEQRKQRYTSVRDMVDKRAAGFTAPYLKLPPGVQMFKPKAGVMLLDIIPFTAGEGNPWAEEGMIHWERTFFVHRGVGANSDSYLCSRKNFNQKCPICEFRNRIQTDGDEDKEDLVKSLMPKERQLFNVINRKEPEKGVQIWDFSFHMFGKLLQQRIRDSDEDDGWDLFFLPDKGLTLKIGFGEKTFNGNSFYEAQTIDFKPRPEPYDDDVLEKALCLDELLVGVDYDTLKKNFLESTEDDAAPKSKSSKKPADDEDEDEDEDLEDEEDLPKKGKDRADERGLLKKPKDDDDDDLDDDEDEEPAPKKSKKPPVEEDEEEDEEEPAPKKKKAPKDEDDDWGDFDDEDEKPKAKKKVEEDEEEVDETPRGGKFHKPKDDDDDDLDDDEDEEPAPKKKKK